MNTQTYATSGVWCSQNIHSNKKIVKCEYCGNNQYLEDDLKCRGCAANLPLESEVEKHLKKHMQEYWAKKEIDPNKKYTMGINDLAPREV